MNQMLKNILFIAVDDLKPMINSYGYDDMITPNIDNIASKEQYLMHQINSLFVLLSCKFAYRSLP